MMPSPYNIPGKSKADEVELMFDNIAPKYDLLNNLLSIGIDKIWRKKVVKLMFTQKIENAIDIATGTGELAIEIAKRNPIQIVGIDISQGMLDMGEQKIKKLNLNNQITLKKADSDKIPFEENYFDAATVSFGVRNFENLEKGLKEIHRVLKPNGKFFVLEFSKPKNFPIKQLFGFYFKNILPALGKKISKDSRAYDYLPESVNKFPEGKNFLNVLEKCGFKDCLDIRLSFGIASIYIGTK